MTPIPSTGYFSQVKNFLSPHMPTKESTLRYGAMIGSVACSVISFDNLCQISYYLRKCVPLAFAYLQLQEVKKRGLNACLKQVKMNYNSIDLFLEFKITTQKAVEQRCHLFYGGQFTKSFVGRIDDLPNILTPVFLGLGTTLANYAIDSSIKEKYNPLRDRLKKVVCALGPTILLTASAYNFYTLGLSYDSTSDKYLIPEAGQLGVYYLFSSVPFLLNLFD